MTLMVLKFNTLNYLILSLSKPIFKDPFAPLSPLRTPDTTCSGTASDY